MGISGDVQYSRTSGEEGPLEHIQVETEISWWSDRKERTKAKTKMCH
jgi:hypothetical protein